MKRDLNHLKQTVAGVEELAASRQQQLEQSLAVAQDELARHQTGNNALQTNADAS